MPKDKVVTVESSQHIEIMNAIAKLDIRMSVQETKMDEIIRRVGIQNGRVADSESVIKKLLSDESYSKGGKSTAKYIIGILLIIATIIVTYVAAR